MRSSWYKTSKTCTALRKHVLRVDLCLFIDDEEAFSSQSYLESTIKSMLTASIIKGLDIVGVLTRNTPIVGWKAVQMAKEQKMDLVVLPGQVYKCRDKEEIYIYKLQKPLRPNLTLTQACFEAHNLGGFVVMTNVTKRQNQILDKLQGSLNAPDAVEIFNEKVGGFKDLNIDYPKFISSGATSANELEISNVFTLIERNKAEEMKLLLENEGVDFIPKYLLPKGAK